MVKKKKYIVTLDDEYLSVLYRQCNVFNADDRMKVINKIMDGVKRFLYGDLDILLNFRVHGREGISIKPFSGTTLKDLRKKGKKIRFV